MIRVLVDADSCPVKEEIYTVALRHQVAVCVVSNHYLRVPPSTLFQSVVVGSDFDAADDYIADQAGSSTVVVTADILLADRCLKAQANVIAPNGTAFTANSIGAAVATRAILEDLRAGGEQHGGQAAFSKADRSRFLSTLHLTLEQIKRGLLSS